MPNPNLMNVRRFHGSSNSSGTRFRWVVAVLCLCGSVFGAPFTASSVTVAATTETVWDVVIYGGNSAAVTAAVQTKKMGKTAVIVCPETHLGGLSSGGLGFTDSGNTSAIGGLSREFYQRVYAAYNNDDSAWKWEQKDKYSNQGQGTRATLHEDKTMWIFEPHIAEAVFDNWVKEMDIPVHRNQWLDREKGVEKKDGRIVAITTLDGKTYKGKIFIDATYEGDLLAAAGVSYTVGREPNSLFNEKWNGNQIGVLHHSHFFKPGSVDPYNIPGDSTSGLVPFVDADPPGTYGEGDSRIQAYCFRMCLTDHSENRVPFPKPKNYDPKNYELMRRVFAAGWRETFGKFDRIPNLKTDTNNHGPFSTDFIGMNYDYPEANYQRRAEIIQEHRDYQQGLMYFLANDPSVPAEIRTKMSTWGLAKDEFTDNGNWPHQLYVREARRMVGEYVTTEHDCLKVVPPVQTEAYKNNIPRGSVGMGSYTMDSHNIRRYVTPAGYVQNEGDIGVSTRGPYKIDFGSIVPKKSECTNLVVPVCVSSTHISYGSIRMEPVFMILGQSSATAACMAIEGNTAVQDVPYSQLAERLSADGQRLEPPRNTGTEGGAVSLADVPGVAKDDTSATLTGEWKPSSAMGTFVGDGYLHDDNQDKGQKSATFRFELKESGKYDVQVGYTPNGNRATNVPVEIQTAGGVVTKMVNQRERPPLPCSMVSLGVYSFGRTVEVRIFNRATNGHVIVDAVTLVPQK